MRQFKASFKTTVMEQLIFEAKDIDEARLIITDGNYDPSEKEEVDKCIY